ncbi:MAG: hypothetical protein LQ340_004032 [Diploschistes diacapsis]|nr:MAG: hypothetical protein LQ340_004032 [Diploschistes diacapsis]
MENSKLITLLRTIHCVRHAQGFHNLSLANHALPDPELTETGKNQCTKLSQAFPYTSSVSLLVASPLRRTLYTALLSFPTLTQAPKNLKIIALPETQETGAVPCDTGLEPEALRKEFKDQPVDLSLVKEGWNSKTGKWAPEADAVRARAKEARQWLKARPEKEIVLVTHGGFLHYLNEDWAGFDAIKGTGWVNAEFRSYSFKEEEGDNASMVETEASRKRRAGTEIPLTGTEELQLRRTTSHKENPNSSLSLLSKA